MANVQNYSSFLFICTLFATFFSFSVADETALDFVQGMHRLNALMILISYLPLFGVEPKDKDYKEGGKNHAIYMKLKEQVGPWTENLRSVDKIGITAENLIDIIFSEEEENDLLDYVKAESKTNDEMWGKQLETQKKVLYDLANKYPDTYLDYMRPHEVDPEGIFAIVVNPTDRRVTVIFRGSQNALDWQTNTKFFSKIVRISGELMRFHEGFWNRLKDERVESPVEISDEDEPERRNFLQYLHQELFLGKKCQRKYYHRSLFEEIKHQLIKFDIDLQRKNETNDYSLQFSGHSLGGALATLSGVLFASDPEIRRMFHGPITIVSVGSPRVGGKRFRSFHQHLEKMGILRHIRVMNKLDLVPTVPKFGGRPYHHVGLRWELSRGGEKDDDVKFHIGYNDVVCNKFKPIWRGVSVSEHYAFVYEMRLEQLQNQIAGQNPDDLMGAKNSTDELFESYYNKILDPYFPPRGKEWKNACL